MLMSLVIQFGSQCSAFNRNNQKNIKEKIVQYICHYNNNNHCN